MSLILCDYPITVYQRQKITNLFGDSAVYLIEQFSIECRKTKPK